MLARSVRPTSLVIEVDLTSLPPLMQTYVRRVGGIGRPRVRNMRVNFAAQMRSSATAPWMQASATQYEFFDPPARLFHMNATLFGVPLDVLHECVDSAATFRVRIAGLREGPMWVIWDPMHFVMEQRMLQGIKERAEGRPFVAPVVQATAQMGWALAGLGILALFISRRRSRPWLLLPIAPGLPILWFTGDLNSALAAFMALGITVAGAVVYGWRWWPPYLLLASGVALVLLLAPDSFAAFGLLFLVVSIAQAAHLILGWTHAFLVTESGSRAARAWAKGTGA